MGLWERVFPIDSGLMLTEGCEIAYGTCILQHKTHTYMESEGLIKT